MLTMLTLNGVVALLLVGTASCHPGQSRVINGTDAEVGSYPFVVSLRRAFFGSHMCGASIINEKWILTAAHCVKGVQASEINIQYGITNIAGKGPNMAAVERIVVHENYARFQNYANDIALLKLEGRLSFNYKTVTPVQLPANGFEVPADNPKATLIGWGYNITGGAVKKHLQEVELKVYSDEECNQRHNGKTTPKQLCGGVDEGGKGQCSGDSGGPLVYGKFVQIGIVSWSIKPCTIAPYPGVYTKVSQYIPWIHETIQKF